MPSVVNMLTAYVGNHFKIKDNVGTEVSFHNKDCIMKRLAKTNKQEIMSFNILFIYYKKCVQSDKFTKKVYTKIYLPKIINYYPHYII